jgi:hypothetical protein
VREGKWRHMAKGSKATRGGDKRELSWIKGNATID